MRTRLAAIACVATGVLTACHGGSRANDATTTSARRAVRSVPPACTLVTKAEADAFLGVPTTERSSGQQCTRVGRDGIAAVQVSARAEQAADAAAIRSGSRGTRLVTGLGEIAGEQIVAGSGAALDAIEAGVYVNVTARRSDPAHRGRTRPIASAEIEALARTALDRL
jgi:hypothetical protein